MDEDWKKRGGRAFLEGKKGEEAMEGGDVNVTRVVHALLTAVITMNGHFCKFSMFELSKSQSVEMNCLSRTLFG